MKGITSFVDLILHTSVFTACCATGLCMATEQLVNLSPPPLFSWFHILVFGSTLVVYNAPRIIPRLFGIHQAVSKYKNWHAAFFVFGIGMVLACLFFIPRQIIFVSLLLAVFAFGYFLPLLPFKNKKRLRDFGWLKIFVLAGVWTVATSILPILYLGKNIGNYPFEILLRLAFIFVLCVVFDIRDMQTDLELNIYTLPHKVGLQNSYRLINVTLFLFVCLACVQYIRYPVWERLVSSLLTAIITKMVVAYLKNYPSERGYLALADGVMLVYAFLVLVPNA